MTLDGRSMLLQRLCIIAGGFGFGDLRLQVHTIFFEPKPSDLFYAARLKEAHILYKSGEHTDKHPGETRRDHRELWILCEVAWDCKVRTHKSYHGPQDTESYISLYNPPKLYISLRKTARPPPNPRFWKPPGGALNRIPIEILIGTPYSTYNHPEP